MMENELEKQADYYSYEPSRHFLDFHLAGFNYCDGLEVIEELKLGTAVKLVPEPDNPYDPEAVAIFYQDKKLGFIPKEKNALISKLLYFGHRDLFEARIQSIDLTAHPERQFRIVIKVKDQRKTAN